jgi:hypothetical protein
MCFIKWNKEFSIILYYCRSREISGTARGLGLGLGFSGVDILDKRRKVPTR